MRLEFKLNYYMKERAKCITSGTVTLQTTVTTVKDRDKVEANNTQISCAVRGQLTCRCQNLGRTGTDARAIEG